MYGRGVFVCQSPHGIARPLPRLARGVPRLLLRLLLPHPLWLLLRRRRLLPRRLGRLGRLGLLPRLLKMGRLPLLCGFLLLAGDVHARVGADAVAAHVRRIQLIPAQVEAAERGLGVRVGEGLEEFVGAIGFDVAVGEAE